MAEKKNDSRTLIIVSIITGIFGILAALVTGLFSLKAAEKAAQKEETILSTSTALAHQVQIGQSTQDILIQTVSAPTTTALAPLVITATQPPTAQTTNTPSLFSFSDDFDDGLDPAWTIQFGKPIVVNGQLTANDTTLLSIGDPSWTNYRVSFAVEIPGNVYFNHEEINSVGVRASDIANMLWFSFNSHQSIWLFKRGGVFEEVPTTNIHPYRSMDTAYISITVEGNKITAYNGGSLISSFITDEFPSGSIYLQIYSETLYDDFKITLLP